MKESTWKAGAAGRRDARHTKGDDTARKPAARKDTKRWCAGHRGREHQLVCEKSEWPPWESPDDNRARHLRCTACGKLLESWYPQWSKERPTWVTS